MLAFTIYNEIRAFRIPDAARRIARTPSSCRKCSEPHEIGSSRWFCSYYNIHGLNYFILSSSNLRSTKMVTRTTHSSTEAIMDHCNELTHKSDQIHKIVITSLSTKREQKKAKVGCLKSPCKLLCGRFCFGVCSRSGEIIKANALLDRTLSRDQNNQRLGLSGSTLGHS